MSHYFINSDTGYKRICPGDFKHLGMSRAGQEKIQVSVSVDKPGGHCLTTGINGYGSIRIREISDICYRLPKDEQLGS